MVLHPSLLQPREDTLAVTGRSGLINIPSDWG